MNGTLKTSTPEAQQATSHDDATLQGPELLTQIQICRKLGICVQTWRNWRERGLTPEPVNTPGVPRWLASEIEQFTRGRRVQSGRRSFFGTAVRRRA